MDLQLAVDNFDRALIHCDNLIAVHRGYGGGGAGRRFREVSLDRAVVVLAIAAWQAAIQDLTAATIDTAAPPTGAATYHALLGHVRKGISDFATPTAQNTRRLMLGAGFDPRPHWTYSSAGGQGRQRVTWTPSMVDTRLDEWLKVRHAIAHGHEELPLVDALEAVRLNGATTNVTLRLTDAEQCVAFVSRLARLTTLGLARHLGVSVNVRR